MAGRKKGDNEVKVGNIDCVSGKVTIARDESFLSRRFHNIVPMVPEVLDLMEAMSANPLAGLGVAARKIAEKAKEDTKN